MQSKELHSEFVALIGESSLNLRLLGICSPLCIEPLALYDQLLMILGVFLQ